MADPPLETRLRRLEPGDTVTGLSLGDAKFLPLKTFLQKHAKSYMAESLAVTYGVFRIGAAPGKILAYMTLVCGEIDPAGGRVVGDDLHYPYDTYPAVKIARLAVDNRYQRYGLGRRLVEFALAISKETICPAVGCRFLVVDAKRDSIEFYTRCGFTLLDTILNKSRDQPIMFVDLKKL